MRTFYRTLRTLSVITLFFFCWTFMPLWQAVAWAAEKQKTPQMRNADFGMRNESQKPQTSGERFEKALEHIREKSGRAYEKHSRGEDTKSEIDAIKAKKAELETIDSELKTDFAATEKKLKDAKLPKEILDRHKKFVKHYENNLKELKTNLDDVDKAKTSSARAAKMQKVREHLDKVKPPKKHKRLDPNNLPHRMVKAKKEKAPRLKKEEFEKDFGPQKKRPGMRNADFGLRNWAKATTNYKPIMLAYNGDISDLQLSSASTHQRFNSLTQEWPSSAISAPSAVNDFNPQSAIRDPQFMVAQAAPPDAPTADDLAETQEVQFTPEIRALAAQLDHNPVKIYNWVRNNIEFVPTYGSIQGAQMTLEAKMGNAFDTASLLIALLRASNIYAHYVYGTIEIPIEKAMNWVGGVTDPKMAGTIIATNGIPGKSLISGGAIKAMQLEHVWVNAFVDYIPSRGAVQRQGNTWIPLDASYKQYNYTQGIDIQTAVPFDAQSFANQIQSTATINSDGSVTNVNSALVQQTMQDYQTRVQNYITQNNPNATVGDVLGKKEIVKQEFPYLMGTLPYKTTQIGAEFAAVPANYIAKITFDFPDKSGLTEGLSYTASVPTLAGKKITLSYEPATKADADLMNLYNGDITAMPAYLLKMRPVIKVAGSTVATGPTMLLGESHDFLMIFNEPGIGAEQVQNVLITGGYSAIILETQRYRFDAISKSIATFRSTLESINAQSEQGQTLSLDKDKLIGEWLWLHGLYYFYLQGLTLNQAARLSGIIYVKGISEAITSLVPKVSNSFGMPMRIDLKSYGIDIDRNIFAVFPKTGGAEKVRPFMMLAGDLSSGLESGHVEMLHFLPAVSTISILKEANRVGIPIYRITKDNINTVLPKLQVSGDVLSDVLAAINAGKVVTVPASSVSYFGWTGVGYIIQDPDTGAGAYRISGGTNGGEQTLYDCLKDLILSLMGIQGYSKTINHASEFMSFLDQTFSKGLELAESARDTTEAALSIYLFGGMIACFCVMAALLAGPAGLLMGIGGSFIVNLLTMGMTCARFVYSDPKRCAKPWWCAIPCAPALREIYHLFSGSANPCID